MTSAAKNPPEVPCPQCSKPSLFAPSNPSRPFCSPRCKQIDMGAWASESHRMVGDDAEPEDLMQALQTPQNLH